jgi:predicted  nucleic acid-binding Zn-ribbon protein
MEEIENIKSEIESIKDEIENLSDQIRRERDGSVDNQRDLMKKSMELNLARRKLEFKLMR